MSGPPGRIEWFVQDGRSHRADDRTGGGSAAFHEKLPGYAPTRLVRAGGLAAALGVGSVLIKDESDRYGLPSFKILGASWAAYRALRALGRFGDGDWETLDDLRGLVAARTGVRGLAAATDGNHGRAVARFARWLGLASTVFVPAGTAAARIAAIESEGARVQVIDGGYGAAVERSAREASESCLVISDTSWPGYSEVPGWVIDGYATIFHEAESQMGADHPDVVVVQAGVGAFAAAAIRHFRATRPARPARPAILAVEPLAAACLLASVRAGRPVTIPGPHDSIMVGLNCDTPSLVAWPDTSRGIDVYLAVDDDAARRATRALAAEGIVAGETGAAGLAGLTEVCRGRAAPCRAPLGLGPAATVLVISTEGATDPDAYARIVGSDDHAGLEGERP